MAKRIDSLAANSVTKERVFEYWAEQERGYNRSPYIPFLSSDRNLTDMGEDAATYFCVFTEEGDSPIEQDIFNWAVDYAEANNF